MVRCNLCGRYLGQVASRTLYLDEKSLQPQELRIFRAMSDLTHESDSPVCNDCCHNVISQVREDLRNKIEITAAKTAIMKNSVLLRCLSKEGVPTLIDTSIGYNPWMDSPQSESSSCTTLPSMDDMQEVYAQFLESLPPDPRYVMANYVHGKQISMAVSRGKRMTAPSSSSSTATEDSVSLGSVDMSTLSCPSVSYSDLESVMTSLTL